MKKFTVLFSVLLFFTPLPVQSENSCTSQKQIESILKYHLWNFRFTEYNEDCSQINQGDFNRDGEEDYVAILTEVKPFDKYANGRDWYRTYVVVFISSNLPYNKYQVLFIRTDGNKPKGISVKAIKTKNGHDLAVILERYSYTRYTWGQHGFKAIEHTAD